MGSSALPARARRERPRKWPARWSAPRCSFLLEFDLGFGEANVDRRDIAVPRAVATQFDRARAAGAGEGHVVALHHISDSDDVIERIYLLALRQMRRDDFAAVLEH